MVPNNINEFESNLLIYVYGNKKRRPRACRIHKSLSFTVTYDGNVVLLDNGLCLWHNARESAESGGTITWYRQPCKHNGSYRGNISFVVKNGWTVNF